MKNIVPIRANKAGVLFGADLPDSGIAASVGLTSALRQIKDAWTKAGDASEKLSVDRTKTPTGQMLAARTAAHKFQQSALKPVDAALASARARADELQAVAAKALTGPADVRMVQIESETRAYFRSLKESERLSILQQAVAAGNLDLVRPVVGAPAHLSSISPEAHAHFRDRFLDAAAPKERADIRELEAASDKVYAAAQVLIRNIGYAFDHDELNKAEAAEKAAQAATAA